MNLLPAPSRPAALSYVRLHAVTGTYGLSTVVEPEAGQVCADKGGVLHSDVPNVCWLRVLSYALDAREAAPLLASAAGHGVPERGAAAEPGQRHHAARAAAPLRARRGGRRRHAGQGQPPSGPSQTPGCGQAFFFNHSIFIF